MIVSAVISLLLLLLLYAPCCKGSWWSTTISSPKPLHLDDPKKCDSNKVSLEVQQHPFVAKEAQFIHLFLFIHFYVFVYPIFQSFRGGLNSSLHHHNKRGTVLASFEEASWVSVAVWAGKEQPRHVNLCFQKEKIALCRSAAVRLPLISNYHHVLLKITGQSLELWFLIPIFHWSRVLSFKPDISKFGASPSAAVGRERASISSDMQSPLFWPVTKI